jgi:hypothetical protein
MGNTRLRGGASALWGLVYRFRFVTGVFVLAMVLGVGPGIQASHQPASEHVHGGAISAEEFSRLVTTFSEDDGFFRSDNFISNETSYLHVLDKLRAMGCTGGAYVGVGPEQNFTYIAKIRPKIAFIIDIRRNAMIQHLMYKAIFHLADTRAEFLSYLFSKPITREAGFKADTGIEQMVRYFETAESDPAFFTRNLERIRRTVTQDFRFPLSDKDSEALTYIFAAFREENLNIQYRSGGASWPGSYWGTFPSFKELLLERDLKGELGNFLANKEDYDFVRGMHERNRIIPVVGDFSGTKAFGSVADYLKKNGYWVTAVYTSNVEQYLFSNGVFNGFAENIRKLPTNDRSIFIRSYPNMYEIHPAKVEGHRLTTLLETVSNFLQDYDQGVYQDYWSLVTTHYIAGTQ